MRESLHIHSLFVWDRDLVVFESSCHHGSIFFNFSMHRNARANLFQSTRLNGYSKARAQLSGLVQSWWNARPSNA